MKNSSRNIICITTCNRLDEVKKYIWGYLKFVEGREDFDFVLALDGNDTDYLEFAQEYGIRLIYSEQREGVGLSKNRVLEKLNDYNSYFFIEDDVEILDTRLFDEILELHNKSNVHHFCIQTKVGEFDKQNCFDYDLSYSWTGGAQFAFYSREGIEKVGGFDVRFAKYKRFGHTEHSYRYFHQGIQKAPFIFSDNWKRYFLEYHPPHVTSVSNVSFNEFGIVKEEQDLIDQKTTFHPIQVISPYYLLEPKQESKEKLRFFLSNNTKRFPLTKGASRKKALAEYYALSINPKNNFISNLCFFTLSFIYKPNNIALKHFVKTKIFGRK